MAEDIRAFLRQHAGKVIFDEIQRTSHLLSYLQETIDQNKSNGQLVLTGSHQLELRAAITQSFAGRIGQIINYQSLAIEFAVIPRKGG